MGSIGLGATVPANCWDAPGFKDCNVQGWNLAETKCRQNGQPTELAIDPVTGVIDIDACKQRQADDYLYYGCAMRICPPPAPVHPTSSGGWTWMNTTPNASVKLFQQHLNTALAADGYKLITADGRLGPATCGAFNFVAGNHPDLFANDPIENIGICQSFTNPTKVGNTKPEPSPTSPEAKQLDKQYGGLPWLVADPRVAALQQQINPQLDSNGFLPIQITGMLDPPTCGAMVWLDQNTGSQWMATWGPRGGGACPSMVMPTPKKLPPKPVPVVPPKPTPAPAPPAPSAATSSLSMLGVGLLALVGVGGYAYYKHKTGGA
jgi:hypothetical protein